MLIQTSDELNTMLESLRSARGDHQWIEAKRARSALPIDLWKSLSALANAGGGLVLLGVDEQRGIFAVTGVEDAAKASAEVQAVCSRAEPPLRPAISIIDHNDGQVLVAHIPAVPRLQQPCHFPDHGHVQFTSFIRVGDGDVQLSASEVDDILAARSQRDDSRRPAPEGGRLSRSALVDLYGRQSKSRDATLRRLGICADDGTPTLAGWLLLGEEPAARSPLARVACMSSPRPGDPVGARQRGVHIEGTIGELLDGVMEWLERELGVVQVSRRGMMADELDFPAEALREALSNALIHRSLSPTADSTTIAVRVTAATVEITSPGGVHPGVDPNQLGLSALSTPRNYALVRMCGQMTSPRGIRLVESQASGIARADRACRKAGTAPLLFAVGPARFSAIALRGRLDVSEVANRWPGLGTDTDQHRLVAFLERREAVQEQDVSTVFFNTPLDTVLAARLLTPCVTEHVVPILDALVGARILREVPRYDRVTWALAEGHGDQLGVKASPVEPAAPAERRVNKVRVLLQSLAADPFGELQPRDVDLGISARGVRDVFQRAIKAGLIESTTDSLHDPTRAYRLTDLGRRQLTRQVD
jgi:predicted HTH transcriptional regulator